MKVELGTTSGILEAAGKLRGSTTDESFVLATARAATVFKSKILTWF